MGTLPSNGVQWSHFLVFMLFCDSFLHSKRAVFTAKSAGQVLGSWILDSIIKYHGFHLNFLSISGQSHSTVPLEFYGNVHKPRKWNFLPKIIGWKQTRSSSQQPNTQAHETLHQTQQLNSSWIFECQRPCLWCWFAVVCYWETDNYINPIFYQ